MQLTWKYKKTKTVQLKVRLEGGLVEVIATEISLNFLPKVYCQAGKYGNPWDPQTTDGPILGI